jgi:hypothetical protein
MQTTAVVSCSSGLMIEAPATITFHSILPSGYGHWKAQGSVEIKFEGKYIRKNISAVTTDAEYFESTKGCETKEEYNAACEAIELLLAEANDERINEMLFYLTN